MEKIEIIKKEAIDLLNKIGVSYELDIKEENGAYFLQINTENDAPYLIGKHGEMIHSLQRILEAIVFKIINEDITILVNINDYREKQKERLEKIADNVAARVVAENRTAYLRSFSAYERKIIHEYIALKYPALVTASEGEGSERKLVVGVKK